MKTATSLGAHALRDAAPSSFWTSQAGAPEAGGPLDADTTADLVIVGAGFTGLWSAWRALDRDPLLGIVILEGKSLGYGASGRNGGFVAASLTHGLAHGRALWPADIAAIHQEGKANLAELVRQVREAGIECDLRESGKTSIAIAPWQLEALSSARDLAAEFGDDLELLTRDQMQADVHSPAFLGGLHDHAGTIMIDPARLVWGMADVLRARGVRIIENSPVTRLEKAGAGIRAVSGSAGVTAGQAIVATAAYPSPLRRLRNYIMPLYDHALMTEPLSTEQLESIGWKQRQGLTDAGNQFHYFRLSADNRILWGGWDANYHRGGRVDEAYEQQGSSHALLANQFFQTFPQLEGLSFSHRWAGPIDATARFTAAYGTSHGGRVAFAAGHTGLGVGASRFSADVALDLLSGEATSRTRYGIVTRKPFPIPPEPIRNPIVQFTRARTFDADNNEGKRGLWLRLLDTFGVGFNS
ncbi:MAG: FAD-binding oxidoreductase [Rhodoglobus sp.]|nr:FAD-binding oxidoreductase [Rhodoglobus sp.]